MDPGSVIGIVTAVGSLVTTVFKAAIGCRSLITKYDDAPQTLLLLENECTTTKAALSYVNDFLMSHATALAPRLSGPSNPLSELVDVALTGCTVTLAMLDGELNSIAMSDGPVDFSSKERAQIMWNEESLTTILERMRGVKDTIQLLLSALNTESLQAMLGLIEAKATMVNTVRYTISNASPPSKKAENSSIFASSTADDREFSFDDEIINTEVYRNAFKSIKRKQTIAFAASLARPSRAEEQTRSSPNQNNHTARKSRSSSRGRDRQPSRQIEPSRSNSSGGSTVTAVRHNQGAKVARSKSQDTVGSDMNEVSSRFRNLKLWTESLNRRKSENDEGPLTPGDTSLSLIEKGVDNSRSTFGRTNTRGSSPRTLVPGRILAADVMHNMDQDPLHIRLLGPSGVGTSFLFNRMVGNAGVGPADPGFQGSQQSFEWQYIQAIPTEELAIKVPGSSLDCPVRIHDTPRDRKLDLMAGSGADSFIFCFNSKTKNSLNGLINLVEQVPRFKTVTSIVVAAICHGAESSSEALSNGEIKARVSSWLGDRCRKIVICDAQRTGPVLRLFHHASYYALISRVERMQKSLAFS